MQPLGSLEANTAAMQAIGDASMRLIMGHVPVLGEGESEREQGVRTGW